MDSTHSAQSKFTIIDDGSINQFICIFKKQQHNLIQRIFNVLMQFGHHCSLSKGEIA